MSDKFLHTGGSGNANISNGTVKAYLAGLTLANLRPSLPVKTNSVNTLISSKLDISDVINLENRLDASSGGSQKTANMTASTQAPNITNITGLTKSTELAANRMYDMTQSTYINLNTTDIALTATNLTFNGNAVLTNTTTEFVRTDGTVDMTAALYIRANTYDNHVDIIDQANTTQADSIGFVNIGGLVGGANMIMGSIGNVGEVQIASYSSVNDLALKVNTSLGAREVRLKADGTFEIADGNLEMKQNEIVNASKITTSKTVGASELRVECGSLAGDDSMISIDRGTILNNGSTVNHSVGGSVIWKAGQFAGNENYSILNNVSGNKVITVDKTTDEITLSSNTKAPSFEVNELANITASVVELGVLNTYTTVNVESVEIVPAGAAFVKIRCWGGGGSGSRLGTRAWRSGGSAFAETYMAVSPAQSFKYYVGQGGDRSSQLGTIAGGGALGALNSDAVGGGGTVVALSDGASYTLKCVAGGGGGLGSRNTHQGGYGGQPGDQGSNPSISSGQGGDNGFGGAGGGGSEPGFPGNDMNLTEVSFSSFDGSGGANFGSGDGSGSGGGGFGGGGGGNGGGNDAAGGGGSLGDIIVNGVTGGDGAGKTQLTQDGLSITVGDSAPINSTASGFGGAVSFLYYSSINDLVVDSGVSCQSLTLAASGKISSISNNLVYTESSVSYPLAGNGVIVRGMFDMNATSTIFADAVVEIQWNGTTNQPQWRRVATNLFGTAARFDNCITYNNSQNSRALIADGSDVSSAINTWYYFGANGAINTLFNAVNYGGMYDFSIHSELLNIAAYSAKITFGSTFGVGHYKVDVMS
jgi:hypothetical protein